MDSGTPAPQDPEELNSVYGDPEYAEVQERLKKRLDALQEKYEVPEELVRSDAE